MIVNCNNNIKQIQYNGHRIKQIVACNHTVYNNTTPTSGGSIVMNEYIGSNNETKIANICSPNIEHIEIAGNPPVVYNNCLTTISSALTRDNVVDLYKTTTTVENGEFADCDIVSAALSREMTSIGIGAFSGNVQMTGVSIGNFDMEQSQECTGASIASIGDYAFKNCTSLTRVELPCVPTPPTIVANVFDGCTELEHIYVPSESVDAYKAADGWSDYSSIIEGI